MDEDKNVVSADKSEENKNERHEKPEGKKTIKGIFATYRGEYNKIIWPSKKDLIKETAIVVVTCLIMGAVITSLDLIFSNGYRILIDLVSSVG